MTGDDPVEAYLDRLLVTLTGPPREIRRTLTEAEAHLLDSAAALEDAGWDAAAARAEAVRRIGAPEAAAGGGRLALRLTTAVRRRLALAALFVGGVAGVAIGAAGLLGQAAKGVWGARALATPFPSGSYTAADCRRWLSGYPSAHDCVAAMTADHADDFLRNAAAAALLGLLALVAHAWLRRRWSAGPIAPAFPGAELVAGAALAGLAGALLLAQGVDSVLVTRAQGAAQPLSLSLAAACAAAYLAARAHRAGWRLQ
jgi:hypothetical protein